jgi:hypothetical protein
MYNTETLNVQMINQAFSDKIEAGMTKEAGVAMTAFVRQRLREESFARKILEPMMITAADLDRQSTDTPTIIAEKEPDSVAVSMAFSGRPDNRYFTGARYPVQFTKISSPRFEKSMAELATYRTDISTVLQQNSVKDLQRQEDTNFFSSCMTMATQFSNYSTITGLSGGSLTVQGLMQAVRLMTKNQLPVGKILINQSTYAGLLAQPATTLGSPLASGLVSGKENLDNFFGFPFVVTNKNDIVQDNRVMIFTAPEYLGQFYLLKDATVYLESRSDIISFESYEYLGIGLGNTNGVVAVDFI